MQNQNTMTVREAADRLGKTPSAIRSRHLARLGAVKILGEWVLDPQRVEAEARGIPAEKTPETKAECIFSF